MPSPNYIEPRYTLNDAQFVPDLHPSILGAADFDGGLNAYTDEGGPQKSLGELSILDVFTGTAIFATGGYRSPDNYVVLVATSAGHWYVVSPAGVSSTISPGGTALTGYGNNPTITAAWMGSTVIINDGLRAPMFLRPTDTQLQLYDVAQFPTGSGNETFTWNYDMGVDSVNAGFILPYNSPRGTLLVAGNLTFNNTGGTIDTEGNSIRWSQMVPLGRQLPTSWALTATGIANELTVPVQGSLTGGFVLADKLYVASPIQTSVIYPINYTGTGEFVDAPQFAVKEVPSSRGLIHPRAVAVYNGIAYGVDAGDIWAFTGRSYTSIAEDTIRKYFFREWNGNYIQMIVNSSLKRIELYYSTGTNTTADRMLPYDLDRQSWQWPHTVNGAVGVVETPMYTPGSPDAWNYNRRNMTYASSNSSTLIQRDREDSSQNVTWFIERTNAGFDDLQQKTLSTTFIVAGVLPEINGTDEVEIRVGGQNTIDGTNTWDTTQNFDPVNQSRISMNQTSRRRGSIRVGSAGTGTSQVTAMNWQLQIEGSDG